MTVEELSRIYTKEVAEVVESTNYKLFLMCTTLVGFIVLVAVTLLIVCIKKINGSKERVKKERTDFINSMTNYGDDFVIKNKGYVESETKRLINASKARVYKQVLVTSGMMIVVVVLALLPNMEKMHDGVYTASDEYKAYIEEYVEPFIAEQGVAVEYKNSTIEKKYGYLIGKKEGDEYVYKVTIDFESGNRLSKEFDKSEVNISDTGRSHVIVYKLEKDIKGVLQKGYLYFEVNLAEDIEYY